MQSVTLSHVVVAAVASVLAAVISAYLTHWFTVRREREKAVTEYRLKAYSDLLNGASRLATARRLGRTSDDEAELAALNDAKTRICVAAPIEVVKALGEFWLQGGTLELEHEILAFTRLCTSIRHSLGHERRDAARVAFSNILFKLEPASYSYKVEKASREKPTDLTG